MKKIITIISISMLFSGCNNDNAWIICDKTYKSLGNELPPNICYFRYGNIEFQDSCHKYNVGDTIK